MDIHEKYRKFRDSKLDKAIDAALEEYKDYKPNKIKRFISRVLRRLLYYLEQ